MIKKILYVVHRYGCPGGSEIYTQNMAEETARRGHDVTVLAGEHRGDLNGIKVIDDLQNLVTQYWDLIVVHGADVSIQNIVLMNAHQIPSDILYMQILPTHSQAGQMGLKNSKWVGCSTQSDWDHASLYQVESKAVYIPHGIDIANSIGQSGFKEKYNIQGPMFLSCGGFWPNKAMTELVNVWNKLETKPGTLVLTGYDNRHNIMPQSDNTVKSFMIEDRSEVLSAISEADCYIMHSHQEGFGLVLLESMTNLTPWISRNIAGATLMQQYGQVYNNDQELISLLQSFDKNKINVFNAYEYLIQNHSISVTVDNILKLIIT